MQSRRRKPQQRARTRHAFFALRRTYLADEQRRANPNLDRGQLSWSRSQNVSQARGRRWQARAYPLPPRTRPTSCVSSPLSLFRTFRGFPRTGNQMKTHRFVQHARAELVQPDLIPPFPPTSDRELSPARSTHARLAGVRGLSLGRHVLEQSLFSSLLGGGLWTIERQRTRGSR